MKLKTITLILAAVLLLSGCAARDWESDETKEVLKVETMGVSTPTPATTPEPAEISLVMVGDILLHTPVEEATLQEDGTYSFARIFENMKEEIQAADVAIVNQEVIIGGEELGISGYPAFNAPYEIGDALVDAGFDVVCHLTEGVNGVTVYKLSEYTEELAGENQIIKQDAAFSLEYCKKLCEQIWS